jgi:hypothetical protein
MVFMPRFATIVASLSLCLGLAFAQDNTALFRQAPPEVEEALRKAVLEFSDLQLEKKWGEAMRKYVVESDWDTYIGSEKDACRAYQILNISYNEDFTEASVGMLCQRSLATPVGGGQVWMPYSADWKQYDGQWKWRVIKHERPDANSDMVMTPFGPVPRNPDTPKPTKEQIKQQETNMAQNLTPGSSLKEIQAPLKADPGRIVIPADKPSTTVAKIRNRFPGVMKIDLHWVRLDGLSASADKKVLNQGEEAEVTIRYEPVGLARPPKNHAVWIETNPMRSATPILIEFQDEAEINSSPN